MKKDKFFDGFLKEIERSGGYIKIAAPAFVKIAQTIRNDKNENIDVNSIVDYMTKRSSVDVEDCEKIIKEVLKRTFEAK